MNCRSCQAKLSARDQKCPSCGRTNPGRELGSGVASGPDRSGPLPPVRSLDDRPSPGTRTARKEPPKPKRSARTEDVETEEPALRLTELVRPEASRSETTREASRGEARKAETSGGASLYAFGSH